MSAKRYLIAPCGPILIYRGPRRWQRMFARLAGDMDQRLPSSRVVISVSVDAFVEIMGPIPLLKIAITPNPEWTGPIYFKEPHGSQ